MKDGLMPSDHQPAPEPRSAADPRPGGKPFYIEPNCPLCGTALVLADTLDGIGDLPICYDEWICPKPGHVELGIYMDWSPEEIELRRCPCHHEFWQDVSEAEAEHQRGEGVVYTDVEDLIRDLND